MKEKLTPTPTEYRGIRFRSKCEAMFALNLYLLRSYYCRQDHLEMDWFESVWVYEPKLEWLGGFSCDFQLTCVELRNEETWIIHRLIEYKPSRPTETFCRNYFRKFYKHAASLGAPLLEALPNTVLRPLIFYGSAYNKERGVIEFDEFDENVVTFREFDWIHDESELLRYRFDLEGGGV